MAPMITSNCITNIQNGEIVQNPILQILDFILNSKDCHYVHLYDATSTIQSLFGSTLFSLFTSSQVEIGSLVEINKLNCKSIQNTKNHLNLPSVGTTCTHITSILHYPLFSIIKSMLTKILLYMCHTILILHEVQVKALTSAIIGNLMSNKYVSTPSKHTLEITPI